MDALSTFEQAVLEKLFAGSHPALGVLRAQAQAAQLVSRRNTDRGFFLDFDVPASAPVLAEHDFHFGDVRAAVDGLSLGAGFVVFVRKGRLEALEGYSYGEPWPNEIRGFQLTYESEPRDLDLPTGASTVTPAKDKP